MTSAPPLNTARSLAAHRLSRAVWAVAAVSRTFERECPEVGLSLPQYRLLLLVRRGPQRAAVLAARAGVRRPTLTALVDGLEKEGLLVRRAVKGDRRGICLELTETGAEALERAEAHLSGVLERLLLEGDGERVVGALEELARMIESGYRNARS